MPLTKFASPKHPPLPLGLYIHIPWCEKKCPYCDFNSAIVKDKREDDYINCLIADLKADKDLIQGRKIDSVFIGGGTPSLISCAGIKKLFDQLHLELDFAQNCEISLEANPGTVDKAKLEAFLQVGINRLSFGVQSFDDNFLRSLGRIHTAEDARQAFLLARELGFDNINLDLIFGLPAQRLENALADLLSATQLAPEHLSWYQLTIEENTAFYKKPPKLPEEEEIFAIYTEGREFLQNNGYGQYEVSAYAQTGKSCHHNLNYWQFGDYLGIGAGAASKLTKITAGEILVYRKTKEPIYKRYLAGIANKNFCRENYQVAQKDLLFEFMLNGLRLKDGVRVDFFSQRTGNPQEQLLEKITPLLDKKLLELKDDKLRPSATGFLWLNQILLEFLE